MDVCLIDKNFPVDLLSNNVIHYWFSNSVLQESGLKNIFSSAL
jgi:hypothetical protein